MRTIVEACFIVLTSCWAFSQSVPQLEFEVASVRPHQSGDGSRAPPVFLSGGRFTSAAPLLYVIAGAYNIPNPSNPLRLSGGPSWITDTVYDIEAKASEGEIHGGMSAKARVEKERSMLQALLNERFKLVIHRETKEMPVYALVIGNGGPKFHKADIEEKDCPADPITPIASRDGSGNCHQISGGRGAGLQGYAIDISDVAGYVEVWTDRPLLDKTGLKGLYRVETGPWLPMNLGSSPPAPGAKQDGIDMADLPTIYTIFERLGLRLEPQKGQVEVYVIDHIEKPSAN
jgi:uncharacterized protein (TIGR03435 family)